MQNGDYGTAPYFHYPNVQNLTINPSPNHIPTPPDRNHSVYASAPPFSASYGGSDHPGYAPYSQNSDHIPASPTAPLYNPPSSNPNVQTFNPAHQPPAFPAFESHVPYQSHSQPQSCHSAYDQHETDSNFAPPPPSLVSMNQSSNSVPFSSPAYEIPYEGLVKLDQGGGYGDNGYGGYSRNRSDFGSDMYNKRPENAELQFNSGYDDGHDDGVYVYRGGKVEPYGARGTAPKSLTWSAPAPVFDDYGRPINIPSKKDPPPASTRKVVKAVPKVEAQEDVKVWVQKFRVKLLAECGDESTMDVLCQVGLDGIRMLDPNSHRTLRMYPLETITSCEVYDSSTLAFWSKSYVKKEVRRIRCQSNKYTTNKLLDIVTAATAQFEEMGGRSRPSNTLKAPGQSKEKKKGLVDWVNLVKRNEEKDHWVPDDAVTKCTACGIEFGAFIRRHHCRNCGDIFCDRCTQGRTALTADENYPPVRVCDRCKAEVTQRLANIKELASRPAGLLHTHEDLAKKLKVEMERNRKSRGSKPNESGKRMKEVACPTCTVHLQVQVPSSGSETIECGVCQHPFLVKAQ